MNKTTITLYNQKKKKFAVCEVEYRKEGEDYILLSAKEKISGDVLDLDLVNSWHCKDDITSQIRGKVEPWKEQPRPKKPSEDPPVPPIAEDIPEPFQRFYNDDSTPYMSL